MNKRKKKKLAKRFGKRHYRDITTVKLHLSVPNGMLLSGTPLGANDIYDRKYRTIDWIAWLKELRKLDTSKLKCDLEHPGTAPIPSFSLKMIGNKIHSFSLDEPIQNPELAAAVANSIETLQVREGDAPLKRPLSSNYGGTRIVSPDVPVVPSMEISLRMPEFRPETEAMVEEMAQKYKKILGGMKDGLEEKKETSEVG